MELCMKVNLEEAIEKIKNGEVVAVPTETVYGLAASIYHPLAIQKIFSLKNRPPKNPLIIHYANLEQLKELTEFIPDQYYKLKKLIPGPLTVVLQANPKTVNQVITAGLETVALRMPMHPLLLELIEKAGPVAAPSANLSGKPSATRAVHVENDFGENISVLDGGHSQKGVESTIIFLAEDHWSLLRLGAVSEEEIESLLGTRPRNKIITNDNQPISPGQLYKHYAPEAKLILCARNMDLNDMAQEHEVDLVLGYEDSKTNYKTLSLGRRNDFVENLNRLYQKLREIDLCDANKVLVDFDFKKEGLGKTLEDRLIKASNQ